MSSAICFNLDQSKMLSSSNWLTLYHTMATFDSPKEKAFGNSVGKGRNADNKHFLHNVFYPLKNKFKMLSHTETVICNCFRFGLG